MGGSELLEGGPELAFRVNELPLILANRTTLRRPVRFAELGAARDTDMVVHYSSGQGQQSRPANREPADRGR